MNDDNDDALDRALFNLALEQPPSDLRASILATTAYAPPPPFSLVEVIALGVVSAVVLWLVITIVMGGGALLEHSFASAATAIVGAFSSVSTLMWIALGGASAFWVSLFIGSQPVALATQRSSRSDAR